MDISPKAIAHFVEFLNGTDWHYIDLNGKNWKTREVNAYADELLQHGLIIAHEGDPYTYSIPTEKEATMAIKNTKAEDLNPGDVVIDPEGNEARVIRIRRIDHQRGRLETDLGVAVVPLAQKFPLVS